MKARVGMVGLGIMGSRMCANLLKAGFDVHAYDVDPAALAGAREGGAKLPFHPVMRVHRFSIF